MTKLDTAYIKAIGATTPKRPSKLNLEALDIAKATEQGKIFETARLVSFKFIKYTEKSPNFGSKYGQDIEPAGRYMLHNEDPGSLATGWISGEITFKKPLVLLLSLDQNEIYGPTGWKARLVAVTGRKRKALSCFLRKLGYDGIVTVDSSSSTREIVDLSVIPC